MMDHYQDDDGQPYISCDWLHVSEYGGAGSVGEANIRALENEDGAFIRHGAYYSRQLWLPDTEENRDLIESLERNYPLVDEEIHSEVELEWERAAWESYGRTDLNDSLPDDLGEIIDDDLTENDQWECYRKAMEQENAYPAMEYSGAYLPIKRIQNTYAELVIGRLLRAGER
jgi:hypothetical protein